MTVYMLIPEDQFQDFRSAYLSEVGEGIPNDSPTDGEKFFVGSSRITPEQRQNLASAFTEVQFSDEYPAEFAPVWSGGQGQ